MLLPLCSDGKAGEVDDVDEDDDDEDDEDDDDDDDEVSWHDGAVHSTVASGPPLTTKWWFGL